MPLLLGLENASLSEVCPKLASHKWCALFTTIFWQRICEFHHQVALLCHIFPLKASHQRQQENKSNEIEMFHKESNVIETTSPSCLLRVPLRDLPLARAIRKEFLMHLNLEFHWLQALLFRSFYAIMLSCIPNLPTSFRTP